MGFWGLRKECDVTAEGAMSTEADSHRTQSISNIFFASLRLIFAFKPGPHTFPTLILYLTSGTWYLSSFSVFCNLY
jgi:hypothetical protein